MSSIATRRQRCCSRSLADIISVCVPDCFLVVVFEGIGLPLTAVLLLVVDCPIIGRYAAHDEQGSFVERSTRVNCKMFGIISN